MQLLKELRACWISGAITGRIRHREQKSVEVVGWFSAVSSAQLLFVAVIDGEFLGNEAVFREAVQSIESGNYGALDWCGRSLSIVPSTDTGLMPAAPVNGWRGSLPGDLVDRWVNASDLEMAHVITVGAAVIHVPKALVVPPRLVLPPRALAERLGVTAEWASLFPGRALVEAVPYRDKFRRLLELRWAQPTAFQLVARRLVHMRTMAATCPNEFALWDTVAGESAEDALDSANGRFGLNFATWDELRGSREFALRASEPLEALVAFGWLGVMGLQLAVLAEKRRCIEQGCSTVPKSNAQRCDEHRESRALFQNRQRQSRHRRRGPHKSP
jgi:hypothetical protein